MPFSIELLLNDLYFLYYKHDDNALVELLIFYYFPFVESIHLLIKTISGVIY